MVSIKNGVLNRTAMNSDGLDNSVSHELNFLVQLHLLSRTQYRFISIQVVPLHVCYMFRLYFGHRQACQYRNLINKVK